MNPRFVVDARGCVIPSDGDASPLAGRAGTYRLQQSGPDLLVFLRTPARGGAAASRPRIALVGDCATYAVSDLIAYLGQSRWSGVVKVMGPSGERQLLLKDGEVRGALSDSPSDRLGELLIRLGHLTRAQVDATVASAPGTKLGRLLVERGLIAPHELYRCLNEQIGEIFHAMVLGKEGTFALVDQELDEKSLSHNLSVSMQGLLMDSFRKIDELAQFRKKIPHGRLFVVRKKPGDANLENEENALLALVDGHKTLLDLAQQSKVSEFEATRIVYRLLEGGYAQLTQVAAPPPASAGARSSASGLRGGPSAADPLRKERTIVRTFNVIFADVRNEVHKGGSLAPFLSSANAALKGRGLTMSPILEGQTFQNDGTLLEDAVLAQYERARARGALGADPVQAFKQVLSDVMFFLLFQAGELLESRADEELAKRVKELLATVESL